MSTGLKANPDGSAAIQVGGTDVITLTSGGAATFVTSPTTVQAGTAAAPSITFTGDTDTGIFTPGANTLAFSTNGTEDARFDSGGNLLLGTTTATNNLRLNEKFSIVTAGNNTYTGAAFVGYSGTADANSCPLLELQRSRGTTDGSFTAVATSDRLGVITFRGADGAAWQDAAYVIGACDGTPTSNTSVPGRLIFATAASGSPTPTERMRLDASGNLLLGGTTARTRITLQVGEANAPALGTASGGAFFGNSNVTYGTLFGTSGAGYGWIQQQRVDGSATAYDLCLQPSGGNLLVGTTDAAPRNFTSGFGFQTGAGLFQVAATSGSNYFNLTSASGTIIEFRRQAGTVGNISSNGSNTTYNSTSDYRLKENIAPMTGALAKVQALKPVTYTWKSTGIADEGFIAHELQEVCPSAVTGEKDAVDADGNPVYQGIDTSFLVATLTAAIQELKAELDVTKAKVAALEGASQ